jgi:oligopeptide/dipeptide ABC transporter ATP-binding protein
MPAPLLQVRDLSVDLEPGLPVLSKVSFAIAPAEIIGLFGESGCGKTTLALSLLKLLPQPRYCIRGSVRFRELELMDLEERRLEAIRGGQISLLSQDPLLALNPVLRGERQVAEVIRAHRRPDSAGVEELFRQVGLDYAAVGRAYPHQMSGGERQRLLLAQALAARPALVIADEPFTALDVTRVVELCELFRRLQETMGVAFLVISHNPRMLALIADQVMVMYAGRIVERGVSAEVLHQPKHPYTRGLLDCLAHAEKTSGRLYAIPGEPPGIASRPRGCAFHPRCADRLACCDARIPSEISLSGGHYASCFQYGE